MSLDKAEKNTGATMSPSTGEWLYYQTLHEFRISENRAFEQRTQLFLAANALLAAAIIVALSERVDLPRPVILGLPILGMIVSFLGIVVGLRIGVSLDVVQDKLVKCEEVIWPPRSVAKAGPFTEGPYTYWDRERRERPRRYLRNPFSTRKLVCVYPMVLFVLLWIAIFLWKMGVLES
jgi:hypothetical protein